MVVVVPEEVFEELELPCGLAALAPPGVVTEEVFVLGALLLGVVTAFCCEDGAPVGFFCAVSFPADASPFPEASSCAC